MANGFIPVPGSFPGPGQVSRPALAVGRTILFYVWDTALGSGITAGQFGDMLTGGFLLPGGGVWRVELTVARAALVSETATSIAISVNSGNTTTDHVLGRNEMPLGETAAAVTSGFVRDILSSSGDLTVYAKCKQASATASDRFTGSFFAERL